MNNFLNFGHLSLLLWSFVACCPCASGQGQTEVSQVGNLALRAQMSLPAASQSLDRAAAIVNGYLILESDIDRELRFESLELSGDADHSLSTGSVELHSEVLQRLIDRQLILQQVALQTNTGDTVHAADIDLFRVTSLIPACAQGVCNTPEGWDQFLAARHITKESFQQYWQQRLMVLNFVEQRFRGGIREDPNAVAIYYRETFLPKFKLSHAPAPPLSAVASQIGDILIEQNISSLLSDWLKTLRTQSTIVVVQAGKEQP